MSVAVSRPPAHDPRSDGHPRRRVRQQVRDALAVAAFSATASTALALAATFVLSLVG